LNIKLRDLSNWDFQKARSGRKKSGASPTAHSSDALQNRHGDRSPIRPDLHQGVSRFRRDGRDDVEADIIGKRYEYLIRAFAEGGGQSAGEFYTPPEVDTIMSRVLAPESGMEIYDPCCGSGGHLIKCEIAMEEKTKASSPSPPSGEMAGVRGQTSDKPAQALWPGIHRRHQPFQGEGTIHIQSKAIAGK